MLAIVPLVQIETTNVIRKGCLVFLMLIMFVSLLLLNRQTNAATYNKLNPFNATKRSEISLITHPVLPTGEIW